MALNIVIVAPSMSRIDFAREWYSLPWLSFRRQVGETSIDHVSSSSPIGALTQIIRRCTLRNLGNWNKGTKKLPPIIPYTHTHPSRFSVTTGLVCRVTRLTLLQSRPVLSIVVSIIPYSGQRIGIHIIIYLYGW